MPFYITHAQTQIAHTHTHACMHLISMADFSPTGYVSWWKFLFAMKINLRKRHSKRLVFPPSCPKIDLVHRVPQIIAFVISFCLWSISYTINMINAVESKVGYSRHWWSEAERKPDCCAMCLMKQKSNSARPEPANKVTDLGWQMQSLWLHFPQQGVVFLLCVSIPAFFSRPDLV